VPSTLSRSISSYDVDVEQPRGWEDISSVDASVFVPSAAREELVLSQGGRSSVATMDFPAAPRRPGMSSASSGLLRSGASWSEWQALLAGVQSDVTTFFSRLLSPSVSAPSLVRLLEDVTIDEPLLAADVGLQLLRHISPTVREHAVYAIERGMREQPQLRAVVAWTMLSDASPGVRAAARDVVLYPQ
jgi:hypothetical protein